MSLDLSIKRMQAQIAAVERAMSLLRAQLERVAETAGGAVDPDPRETWSGLAALLRSGEALAARSQASYAPFAEGVCVAFDPDVSQMSVVVAHDLVEASPLGVETIRHGRLLVHPVFKGATRPRWLTLETSLFADDLLTDVDKEITATASVQIEGDAALTEDNLYLTLRLEFADRMVDLATRSIPLTTVPMAFSIPFEAALWSEVDRAAVKRAILLIGLPTDGTYRVAIDAFAVRDAA